jgi:hypothetical protein
VRVLLDENLPHDLIAQLTGHDVITVQGLGWAGVKNGDLLGRAAGVIDLPLVAGILETLPRIKPGLVEHVGG